MLRRALSCLLEHRIYHPSHCQTRKLIRHVHVLKEVLVSQVIDALHCLTTLPSHSSVPQAFVSQPFLSCIQYELVGRREFRFWKYLWLGIGWLRSCKGVCLVSSNASFLTRRQATSQAKSKAPKATKAPTKPKPNSSKNTTKNKPAKKKVLADIDDNAEDSNIDMDDKADTSLSEDDRVEKEKPAAPAKKKTASETYTKVTRPSHW